MNRQKNALTFTDFDNIRQFFPHFSRNSQTFPWPWKIFVFPLSLSDGGNPDVEMFIMLVMCKYNILWGSFSQY